jgi:hypothetical protein
MKSLTASMLVVPLIASLCGCGNNSKSSDSNGSAGKGAGHSTDTLVTEVLVTPIPPMQLPAIFKAEIQGQVDGIGLAQRENDTTQILMLMNQIVGDLQPKLEEVPADQRSRLSDLIDTLSATASRAQDHASSPAEFETEVYRYINESSGLK